MSKPKNITLQNWLELAHRACRNNNPKAPHLIAAHILKLSQTQIISTAPQKKLTQKKLAKLNNLLGKVLAGRSLAATLGKTDFYNLKLKINSKVLVPRAETEQLIEFAVQNIPANSKVLDIGCGSGAIGLSLAKARPDLTVILSDINPKALSLARTNAAINKLKNHQLEFIRSNLIKKVVQKDLSEFFFLANLPYVSKSWPKLNKKSLSHEPKLSLFATNQGLQIILNLIHSLLSQNLLTSKNWLLIEHDPKQFQKLQKICQKSNLSLDSITSYISKISKKD